MKIAEHFLHGFPGDWPQIHDSFGNVGYFLAIHALEDISRKFVTHCQ
jgi:hypothetical protein